MEKKIEKNLGNGAVIFLCGGSGKRMSGTTSDKVLERICGVPVILFSVKTFAESRVAGTAIFVCRDDFQQSEIEKILDENLRSKFSKILFCRGGKERGDSVLSGLKTAISAGTQKENLAFIHDGARPFVTKNSLLELEKIALQQGAAVLAKRCVNTIKRAPENVSAGTACVPEDLSRERLWEMETPQVFPLGKIFSAYEKIAEQNLHFTDDVSAFCRALSEKIAFVENTSPNPKITVPADFAFAEFLLRERR